MQGCEYTTAFDDEGLSGKRIKIINRIGQGGIIKMSCNECHKEQESREKEYYFRIENANILVFGCEKHVTILRDILRGKN
jgi:hypothetical protein